MQNKSSIDAGKVGAFSVDIEQLHNYKTELAKNKMGIEGNTIVHRQQFHDVNDNHKYNITTFNKKMGDTAMVSHNINSHDMKHMLPKDEAHMVRSEVNIDKYRYASADNSPTIAPNMSLDNKDYGPNNQYTDIYIHMSTEREPEHACYSCKACCCDAWFIGKIALAGMVSGTFNYLAQHDWAMAISTLTQGKGKLRALRVHQIYALVICYK